MSVTVAWDNAAHTIIRCEYEGEIDGENVRAALAAVAALLEGIDYPVDFINNLSSAHIGSEALIAGIRAMSDWPPHTRRVVVVSGQAAVRAAANVVRRLYPKWRRRVFIVDTVAEARQILAAPPE